MKRAAIYVRVSTEAQATADHVSLEVQEQRCRDYVAQHGWSLVAVECDTESGLKPTRAGYQRVLALARAHSIDLVCVFQASRFGRKASEVLTRVEEMRSLGVDLVSTSEDLTSFLMLGIQAVLNEEESRRILSRTMPAKYRLSEQGKRIAPPPFGCVTERGLLKPGPDFDLIRTAFELCAQGVAIAEIARRISASIYPREVKYHTLLKSLRNESYVGRVHYGPVDAVAAWEPLIDPGLFERAQLQIAKRYVERRALTRSYPYWVLGIAFCAHCGWRMHPKVSVSRWTGTPYPYLVCGQRKNPCDVVPYVKIPDVQAWVLDQVERLDIDAASVDRYIASMRDDTAEYAARRRALAAERERLARRVVTAKAAHLDAPETYTIADVKQIEAAVRDGIAAIDRELAEPPPAATIDTDSLRRFLLDRSWLDTRDSDPQAFRAVLQRYVPKVMVAAVGDYRIIWAPVLEAMVPTLS